MSRLPMITAAQAIKALKRVGFIEHHQKGSHLYLWHPGHLKMTSVAMHPGDLPRGTTKAMIEQAGLTQNEFQKLL